MVWYDYLPAQVTPERRRAYVAALQQLLLGARAAGSQARPVLPSLQRDLLAQAADAALP